jgi:pimeloyl-ACP methyl ester carboxylesterase
VAVPTTPIFLVLVTLLGQNASSPTDHPLAGHWKHADREAILRQVHFVTVKELRHARTTPDRPGMVGPLLRGNHEEHPVTLQAIVDSARWSAHDRRGRRHYPPDPDHDVDIIASDGVVLKASYFSPGKVGPGIVLFHQCNWDRHAWDTLTPDLVNAGFHVLSIDQRGFGDTPGSRGPADERKGPSDFDAAYTYFLSKQDVDRSRLAAGGASCGVAYSAALANRHHEIKALVLLSGGADENSRAYMRATPSLAVFGAAAGNKFDVAETREAVAASHHQQSIFRIVRGSAHGVAMFEKDADLKLSIVQWLTGRFASNSAGAGRERRESVSVVRSE